MHRGASEWPWGSLGRHREGDGLETAGKGEEVEQWKSTGNARFAGKYPIDVVNLHWGVK